MTILPDDLFDFCYFYDFQSSLRELAQLAMPESWAFLHSKALAYSSETAILERYIRNIYRHQAITYNVADDPRVRESCFVFSGPWACFHTGLMTQHFQPIYALMELNHRKDTRLAWIFKGFFSAGSPRLRHLSILPKKPMFQRYEAFYPEWEIRINFSHILQDSNNINRLPESIRMLNNLPLLLQASVLYGSSLAMIDPTVIVPQLYCQQIQYLMPICLTDVQHCDLAMTLMPCDGFYLGTTYLTLEMAYINARMLSRPSTFWLADLVKEPDVKQIFPYEAVYHMYPPLEKEEPLALDVKNLI